MPRIARILMLLVLASCADASVTNPTVEPRAARHIRPMPVDSVVPVLPPVLDTLPR